MVKLNSNPDQLTCIKNDFISSESHCKILTGVVVAFALEVELVVVAEASLAVLLSMESDLMGGCDMTTGCGAVAFDVLIIGLICVEPTFIVGVVCCIALPSVAVFNIFAVQINEQNKSISSRY